MRWLIAGIFGIALCAQAPTRTAESWIDEGKADLARYHEIDAEAAFRKAIELRPDSAQAHLLLARALIGQLPPNLMMLPDPYGILPKAEEAARRALELAPGNAEALCVSGIVSYDLAKISKDPREKAQRLNRARDAFQHALEADPKCVEAHAEMAHMASDLVAQALLGALARVNPKPPVQPGPLPDPQLRGRLRARYQATIEMGMSHAQKALQIDAQSEPVMRYMAGLLIARAVLQDNEADFAADWNEATAWQKKLAEVIGARGRSQQLPQAGPGGVIGGILSAVPTAPPPPPPTVNRPNR